MSRNKNAARIGFEQIELTQANQKKLAKIAIKNTPPEEARKQKTWERELAKLLESRKQYGNFFHVLNQNKQPVAALFTEPATVRDKELAYIMLNKDGLQVIETMGIKSSELWPFTFFDKHKKVPGIVDDLDEYPIDESSYLSQFLRSTQHRAGKKCDTLGISGFKLYYENPDEPWHEKMLFGEDRDQGFDGRGEYYIYKPLKDPSIAREAYMNSVESTAEHLRPGSL